MFHRLGNRDVHLIEYFGTDRTLDANVSMNLSDEWHADCRHCYLSKGA